MKNHEDDVRERETFDWESKLKRFEALSKEHYDNLSTLSAMGKRISSDINLPHTEGDNSLSQMWRHALESCFPDESTYPDLSFSAMGM